MDKYNQLIAKAISTTSDDEALSCLRMAKKIGGTINISNGEYNGKTAEYWYDKAKNLYDTNKNYESSYQKVVSAGYRVSTERDALKKQVKTQSKNIDSLKRQVAVLSFITVAAIILAISAPLFA